MHVSGAGGNHLRTAVHTAVNHYFKVNYPAFDPATGTFDTEISIRKDTSGAYYAVDYGTPGSRRFDAYEDVGNGTVCGYDVKTGERDLTGQRINELRDAAIGYYENRHNGVRPRQVLIMQVKPWR